MIRLRRTLPAWTALVVSSIALSSAAESGAPRPESEDFVLHCSGCHGLDGAGVAGIAPDLREIGGLLQSKMGREYLGRVPGVAQAPLDDEALARLLNWTLSELARTPPNPPYTANEIRALRARPLRDPRAIRQSLVPPDP